VRSVSLPQYRRSPLSASTRGPPWSGAITCASHTPAVDDVLPQPHAWPRVPPVLMSGMTSLQGSPPGGCVAGDSSASAASCVACEPPHETIGHADAAMASERSCIAFTLSPRMAVAQHALGPRAECENDLAESSTGPAAGIATAAGPAFLAHRAHD